jgi:cyclic-di-GMP-binding protein
MLLNFIAPGRGAADEGDFSPEKMRAFLNALPPNDPKRAARALIERLVALNRAALPGRMRLRLLDMVRDHVDWLLPQLEVRVAKVTPPLSAALREAAYCIEKVLKELAAGYTGVVVAAPRAWLAIGFKSQLNAPLTRAMDFHARRLALSQRLYARSPGAVWAELHQLFRIARDWGIVEREADSPRTSPLRVYRETLLLAFAQPTKLMHGDFSRVQAYLAAHGDLAELTSGAKFEDAACVFAIDPRRDRPGVAYTKRADLGFENGELALLTHRLVERLEGQLKKLRDGVAPSSLGLPDEARTPGYRELLQRLVMHWRGDRKQRQTRMRFHPRVELWVGLREIWRVLRADAPAETPQADITTREQPMKSSEWIISNESARGFALKFMSGALPPIDVGEIVAVKSREQGTLYVCFVRWIQSNNPEHFELGLQQIAPLVVPAVYKPNEQATIAAEPVLFFPEMPAQKRAPAIVAPPNRLQSNEQFSLRHRRGRLALRVGRVIEKTPSVDLIEVLPSPAT